LWSMRLSSPAQSNPMSFVGQNGRQYVVVAESGSKPAEAEVALVAFALPRAGDAPVDLKPAPAPIPAR
jgi:glucose dehydrogenase